MLSPNRAILFITVLIVVAPYSHGAIHSKNRCRTCKNFVESFEKGLKATENSNFAGGDTSWEEEKLGSYATSEVRLVEILDTVCGKSDYQCNRLVENNEEDIERWWFQMKRNGEDDLKTWLCFEHLDVCCPENTYGPKCTACPGGTEDPCGGHGKCEGAEEKDGVGGCVCDVGYEGELCQACASGYYNDSDGSCLACDKACKDDCTGPGAGECVECASGYEEDEEGVCRDKDECKENGSLCSEGTYCQNTAGSYLCKACHKACLKGCSGPGPVKCVDCASGYEKTKHGVCKDIDECQEDGEVCSEGTYCENKQGTYICKACHLACRLSCSGPGAENCAECNDGYTTENGTCADVNECEQEQSPCDLETETCLNLVGTHKCKCRPGLVRVEGRCVTEEMKEKEQKSSKQGDGAGKSNAKKKKKKKKKKTKKGAKSVPQDGTELLETAETKQQSRDLPRQSHDLHDEL